MKTAIVIAAVLAAACCGNVLKAENVTVNTPGTSLVLGADKGKKLKHLYYGTRLTDADVRGLKAAGAANVNAYPDYGVDPEREAAIAAVHADGNMTLDLVIDGETP